MTQHNSKLVQPAQPANRARESVKTSKKFRLWQPSIDRESQIGSPKLTGATCLSRCPDNIVAEVLGADLSLLLYESFVDSCLAQNAAPLPLDRIQRDMSSVFELHAA